jgi:hypothetical protein
MNNNNDFQQYGFDHYDQVPLNQKRGLAERMFGLRAAMVMRSPLVTTAAFLLVGAAVAGVVISSYPGEDASEVPVVKADTFAYKQAPSERGGMEISNQDSTIYMSMNDGVATESAPIENLLEDDTPVAQIEEFSRQVEEIAAEESVAAKAKMAQAEAAGTRKVENLLDGSQETVTTKTETVAMAADSELKSPEPPKMAIMHEAGSNPETLEFVRSVLDKKDERMAAASADAVAATKAITPAPTSSAVRGDAANTVADIMPAAGSQVGAAISPGDYFVQLASIGDVARAAGEWTKLQKAYSAQLTGVDYRVQSADLGARGVFHRIQAGPMAKASAQKICDEIKAQKPGGCLVTK